MLSRVQSSAVLGIDAYIVDVEVDISFGLPKFSIVGLPEASVKESKERVKAAINNSGYNFPDDIITINLAPANIRKEGTGFDLPISLGILAANKIIPGEGLKDYLILGELSLDGRIKPVKGSLPMAIAAKHAGINGIIVPENNSNEAGVIEDISVIPVKNLSQVVEYFRGNINIEPVKIELNNIFNNYKHEDADFSEVHGQEHVKRAIEIAASGGHNMIMIGPPGSGKTMLAKRIPSILPPLTFNEAIETTKIYSVSGMLEKDQSLITQRPFRSPHHTISDAGLIGGGHIPRPGEVSLSHNGVLFLDEIAEFKKNVLEVLRQPVEDQIVNISRAAISITYPSSFMLIAAMNPCACGFYTDPNHDCKCSPAQIMRYRTKISGPLMDRIDIHIDVPAVPYKDLRNSNPGENSKEIRERVKKARDIQLKRFSRAKIYSNSQMKSKLIKKYCAIDNNSHDMLEKAIDKFGLSARAFNRILKIARTIADLENSEKILTHHVSEAVQYRSLDRSKGFSNLY